MVESILQPQVTPKAATSRKANITRGILIGLGVITLLALGGAGVFTLARKNPELLGIKKDTPTEEDAQKELATLVSEIGKIMELPTGETPTLATVSDLEQVKSQPFFAKAKNGDRVLVYANARKAILYRPSEKKIIEVGVVNVPSPTGEVAGQETQNIQVITPTPLPTNTATATPVSVQTQELPTATPTPQITQ